VVEDVNDHMPTFPTSEMVVCEQVGQLGSVLVVAEDHDQSPFSSPFSFSLPNDNDGKWSLTKYNGKWLYFDFIVFYCIKIFSKTHFIFVRGVRIIYYTESNRVLVKE